MNQRLRSFNILVCVADSRHPHKPPEPNVTIDWLLEWPGILVHNLAPGKAARFDFFQSPELAILSENCLHVGPRMNRYRRFLAVIRG
jgi:hypothetical protein